MRSIFLGLSLLLVLLSGCGYHLGGIKPVEMEGVDSIYIKIAENSTQYIGVEADLTNFLTDALIEDTTYRVGGQNSADAILETKISNIEFRRIRAAITDGLRPEELEMLVTVNWRVIDRNGKLIKSGKTKENTRFFVDNGRLTTARENAFPDAFARVSRKLVSTISNSF